VIGKQAWRTKQGSERRLHVASQRFKNILDFSIVGTLKCLVDGPSDAA
jgi:hypothetical protein